MNKITGNNFGTLKYMYKNVSTPILKERDAECVMMYTNNCRKEDTGKSYLKTCLAI